MMYTLSALLLLATSSTVLSQNIELMLSPESRLLPLGTDANFSCKFRNVQPEHRPFWKVNQTEASNNRNRMKLMDKGLILHHEKNNEITTLTLRVNNSSADINNTHIQCRTLTSVHSEIATILIIAELPFIPNPLYEQARTSILSLKWCPPFLWPGFYIRNYSISVTDDSSRQVDTYQVNATTFSEAVITLQLGESYHICREFTFGITPGHQDLAGQTRYVSGGYYAPLGKFNVSATAFFRADGTPLVRTIIKPSHGICSYQELNITVSITDRATKALVTEDGSIPHRGNDSIEYDITSSNLQREMEYVMTVTLNTGFQSSNYTYTFNTSLDPDLYPTNSPCTPVPGTSGNGQNAHQLTYKVAMGACLGLATLMLFMLISVCLCFLIHRQRRIFQGKALNLSTNRMQNAMVHNPIYDGPVYESVQPHFDILTASVKQDLSLSNTSASNSPPRSSSPPDTGSNNSQRMVRYLDRPIQPRSLSLSHPSTPDNNNPSAIGVPAAQTTPSTRAMGLKKNGKERNKLHLTLTLDENESANPAFGVSSRKEEETMLVGDVPGNKRDVTSDGDENYAVMSPIKRKDGGNIIGGMTELSPEDTDKYKEEVN